MTATQMRDEIVRLIKSRLKKNKYTQARPGYVFGKPEGTNPGYGDCSETVRAVIKRVAGIDIGGNTSAQWANAKAGKHGAKIVDRPTGVYFDEKKLKPGDCLYFKGNPSHLDGVGHVEMYTGKNECVGHGSGTGPTKKNLRTYCGGRTGSRRALAAVRWIGDDGSDSKVYKLGDRALSMDMVADDVGELQGLLVKLGYNIGTYGPGKDGVDCDYGAKTAAAVKVEQKRAGLAQTGNADLATIEYIIARAGGAEAPVPKQYVLVSGGTVYVRRGPSTSYGILGVVKSGERYEATGQVKNGWYEIIYKGVKAWISGKLSEIVK